MQPLLVMTVLFLVAILLLDMHEIHQLRRENADLRGYIARDDADHESMRLARSELARSEHDRRVLLDALDHYVMRRGEDEANLAHSVHHAVDDLRERILASR